MINKKNSFNYLRIIKNIIFCLAPKNRYGDFFIAYLLFIFSHKRLPTSKFIFNDVLFRIKVSNEILDPLRVFVSDKEYLKIYVKSVIGDQYNVPTIDVIRNVDNITDYQFPSNCCIKPTHASGKVILRNSDSFVDRSIIKDWFFLNYYKLTREANYKLLIPKVIIEPLIFDKTDVEDFKFFCYKGVCKIIQVDIDRFGNHKRLFFDANWNPLSFSLLYPISKNNFFPKPRNFDEMLYIASILSSPFGFIRVDLYSNGLNCYVGEITNCHGSSSENFIPIESEYEVSKIIFQH